MVEGELLVVRVGLLVGRRGRGRRGRGRNGIREMCVCAHLLHLLLGLTALLGQRVVEQAAHLERERQLILVLLLILLFTLAILLVSCRQGGRGICCCHADRHRLDERLVHLLRCVHEARMRSSLVEVIVVVVVVVVIIFVLVIHLELDAIGRLLVLRIGAAAAAAAVGGEELVEVTDCGR